MDATLPPPEILDGLRRMGLLQGGTAAGAPPGDPSGAPGDPSGAPLTGGVSSDIWRIDLPAGPICVKRALGKLRVAADWRAPVRRNRYEAAWMRRAAAAVPGCVPKLLGQDEESGSLAMAFLPADRYALWKSALRDGRADPAFAAAVATALVRIHAATAGDFAVATEFPTDAIFFDIRLEPYLLATAAVHPDRADALRALVATTQASKCALVHGDVSPKNILVGPCGPVFLDAECAWWGDPAFDAAFCLNHLLLKCLWNPGATNGFLACYDAFAAAYLAGITWEPALHIEARIAHLLPGLLLARVDGKSPVEYISADAARDAVRRPARALLAAPVDRLAAIRAAWTAELKSWELHR